MRICVNIKVWQRPEVFANVCRSIRDQQTVHEIVIAVALSPDDPDLRANTDTADEYCDHVLMVENQPLSTKANRLARRSSAIDFDCLMVLGSDDVVGPGFFDAYDFRNEAWGWSDMYLYEPGGQFAYWPGYDPAERNESIGAGRVLSRRICERLNWQLHEEGLSRNLDKSTTQRLAGIGVNVPHEKLPEGVYLVDCKDSVSITPMDAFTYRVQMEMPECLQPYL